MKATIPAVEWNGLSQLRGTALWRALRAARLWVRATWIGRWLRLWTRYLVHLKGNLSRQLRRAGSAATDRAVGPRILVPLIETTHYQFFHVLAVAKALQLRGAQVKVLLCGSRLDGCEIKSAIAPRTDPCMECRFHAQKVVPLFDLDVSYLADYISQREVESLRAVAGGIVENYPKSHHHRGVDIIPIVDDSVVRHYYGGVPVNNPAELNTTRRQHLVTSMIGLDVAPKMDREWHPDIVFGNMQNYSAWKPYERYFTTIGKKYITVNLTTFDHHSVTVCLWDLFYSGERYRRWLAARQGRGLDSAERAELDRFTKTRFSGRSDNFRQRKAFTHADTDLVKQLKLDTSKRNVFLFSNVFWEGGINETNTLYEDVVSWVTDTVELLRNEPGCHLYVKVHPGEKYNGMPSRKGIEGFIRDRYEKLPENLTIIRAEDKILTYRLFPYVDIGVVFNGTLGIEMLLNGISTIVCALAPYSTLACATTPKSREEYRSYLTGARKPSEPNLGEAETFAYFYFVKALIPWTLTNQAFGDDFKGFAFDSLDELLPGRDPYLDHICNCILDPAGTVVEGWSARPGGART